MYVECTYIERVCIAHACVCVYRIAGNFRGRKLSWIRRSENFAEKTSTDCLKQIIGGCGTPPNFAEKTFADGSQTSKSMKVFSLESFPLYGMLSVPI